MTVVAQAALLCGDNLLMLCFQVEEADTLKQSLPLDHGKLVSGQFAIGVYDMGTGVDESLC